MEMITTHDFQDYNDSFNALIFKTEHEYIRKKTKNFFCRD